MIRLGSLAGYSFEGPVALGGWEPPAAAGVFAVLYRLDPEAAGYAVVYAGHCDDLSAGGFPYGHPSATCWQERAGSKEALLVAWFVVPGATRSIRSGIANELNTVYAPPCADEPFDPGWGAGWEEPPGGGGSGGVREPCHPRPSPIAGAAAAEPDR